MGPRLNDLQRYLVDEFVEDYNAGRMSRRELIGRVLGIAGGIGSAATLLLALGCQPQPAAQPAATAAPPPPTPQPTAAPKPTQPAATTAPTQPPVQPTAAAAPTRAASPAPTQPAGTPPAGQVPTPAPARSKYSVKPDDPAIEAADITFSGDGATLMGYLARPKGGGPFPAVLVCHENRGLVEHIRDVTRRLAKAGFVGLAVDLLARDGGTARVDPAQVPGKLSASPDQGVADFKAAFRHLQSLNFVQKDRIGMVGFCLGGNITWRVATAVPELKAAVPFYGPAPAVEDVPKIQAAILGIYGETDQRVNAGIPAIEDAMKKSNKTFEKMIYPGAAHAFHNDTGGSWNEQAAYDAWEKALAWFKKYLA